MKGKRICIVHIDSFNEDENPMEVSNERFLELAEQSGSLYSTLEALESDWNRDFIFYPDSSYMRVI